MFCILFFLFSYTTYVAGGGGGVNSTHLISTLGLISGMANLKTQGILQIDLKESKSVFTKLIRDDVECRTKMRLGMSCWFPFFFLL